MLEIVLKEADTGVRAVVTGEVMYEYNEKTMQYTLVNLKTGARLQLNGLIVDEVLYEHEEPVWVSNPELPALMPPKISKEIITMTLVALPVEKLLKLFNTTVQVPEQQYPTATGVGPDLSEQSSNALLVGQLAQLIPGMDAEVKFPEECIHGFEDEPVRDTVIHLNDRHRWTYQRIADWLDTLDVDLSVRDLSEEEKTVAEFKQKFMLGVDDVADMSGMAPEWKDVGYIEEDQHGGKASNHFTQGKTVGTTEGCMTVTVDGVNIEALKLYTGITDQKED